MVRETRYLWVGNLPEKISEERVIEHFERYGKIQSVKLLSSKDGERPSATVAFMDIKSASKAHHTPNEVGGVPILTEYSEPPGSALSITRTLDAGGAQGLGGKGQHGRYPRGSDGLSDDLNYDRSGDWYPAAGTGGSGGRNATSEGSTTYEGRSGRSGSASTASANYDGEDYPAERGRSKQRFPAPTVRSAFQRQQHYDRESGSGTPRSQFDGAYTEKGVPEKQSARVRSKATWGGSQSPARSDVSSLSSRREARNMSNFGRSSSRSGSRSRSSSSSSSSRSSSSSSRSGSRRTGTVKSEVASKKDMNAANSLNVSGGGGGSGSGQENNGEKRNLGICIRGLPMRSTDSSLRDGLYHEYKKHGKVTSVSIFGQGDDRYAIVSFKKPEDATKAIEASHEKMFFGTKIHVTSHEGFEAEDDFKTPDPDLDEFHPKATRTLFVGNLEKEISIPKLKDIFKSFGEIIDIDIKKQGAVSAYAFVQYGDITSVVRALRKMDGEHIGANKIKLGFGKSMPTNCVWLDNVAETVTEKALCRHFGRYGPVSHSVIDKVKGRGLIYFDNMDFAQHAVNEMRARVLSGKKIHIDFASRDCQTSFFEKMERTGQLRPGERPDERAGRVHRPSTAASSGAPGGAGSGGGGQGSGQASGGGGPGTAASGTSFSVREAFASTRSSRLSRADSSDSSFTFNNPGSSTGTSRTFSASSSTSTRANFTTRGRTSRSSRSGFFEAGFSGETEFRERRQSRHYDEYGTDGVYGEDTYEQELRAYGYRQQERREQRGSLSPPPRDKRREVRADSPFSRSSRHQSPVHDTRHDRYDDRYSDRYSYRDTDSQSGDRESVRSYRSVRSEARRTDFRAQASFEDRFPERFVEEKQRGFSPASSDYSRDHSPGSVHYRSRSNSPTISVDKEARKVVNVKERVVVRQVVASSSLDDYTQSSRHSSPMDYDMGKPLKDSHKPSKYSSSSLPLDGKSSSKDHYPETRDSRERYGSEERTTISKLIGKTRTGSSNTLNDSGEKVTAVSSRVKKPNKFDSDDDVVDIQDRVAEVKDRPSFSNKKRHSEQDLERTTVVASSSVAEDGTSKRLHKHRSRSTSLGSRTRHSMPNDSLVDIADCTAVDLTPVVKPTKDVPSSEVVGLKTKAKVVKSADVPRSSSSTGVSPTKKVQTFSSAASVTEQYDPFEPKSETCESSSGSTGGGSDYSSSDDEESSFVPPPADTSGNQQSDATSSSVRLQKQREHLLLLIKQLDDMGSSQSDNDSQDNISCKRGDAESRARSRLYEEIEQTKLSIRELDREHQLQQKAQHQHAHRKPMEQARRQRQQPQQQPPQKPHHNADPRPPASPSSHRPDIDDVSLEASDVATEFKKKRKGGDPDVVARWYRSQNASDDLYTDDDRKLSKKEAVEIKEVDALKDRSTDGRSSSVDTSEHTSRQSSIESQDPRSPPLDYRNKGIIEIKTDADAKDSPVDRRSLHLAESQSKKEFPINLPLPKFARQTVKDTHAGKNSPKSHVSPRMSTLQVAAVPAGIQVKSPPFSPGGALSSPLHSPALPRGDTPKDASSLPNSLSTPPGVSSSNKDTSTKEMKAPAPPAIDKDKSKAGLSVLASPGSPPIKTDSDSEVSESEPGELSLEERIRQLDEKLSLTTTPKPPTTPGAMSLSDYREKYKIRKRADSSSSNLTGLNEKSEPSDIVKSLLARTSIFDQDSKRLEQIHEKYEPKQNVALEDSRFRTKTPAKELPILTLNVPTSLGQHTGSSAPQLSPPFLGAPAGVPLTDGKSLGDSLSSSGLAASASGVDGSLLPPLSPSHKGMNEVPQLPPPPPPPPPPPAVSCPQSSPPPAQLSPTISQQPMAASPKITGLDTMPQLSVAVNTPSISPGLISRKGSLESATKSPLTPPVATMATSNSNVASMPSPSQTQPPQLECLSTPKQKDSVLSLSTTSTSTLGSASQLSPSSSTPSTPVSILKKQDSNNEVFSPVVQSSPMPLTPILKKPSSSSSSSSSEQLPPLTPVHQQQQQKDPASSSLSTRKADGKDTRSDSVCSSSGTPLKSRDSSSSLLGKRKASGDDSKQQTNKQDKNSHKVSTPTATPKHEMTTSSAKTSGGEPEAKKAKLAPKEKPTKSSLQKDKKASSKHGSNNSSNINSKSPEKKHVKQEPKEQQDKKKPDDRHVKHAEKLNNKEKLQVKEEEIAEKGKSNEASAKAKDPEKDVSKHKEHAEKDVKEVQKGKEQKHKTEKAKEVKEAPEKKVEKSSSDHQKKRYKSGDNKHRDSKDKAPAADTKAKTPIDNKHKDSKHKPEKEKPDKTHKAEKHDRPEKAEKEEKQEKPEQRSEKSKTDHSEKANKSEPKDKSIKHDKKQEKPDPKQKHKEKAKESAKEKKDDRNKSSHESSSSNSKTDKRNVKDSEKKRQKEREQEKKDRESEKSKDHNRGKDKKNKESDSHKDTDGSAEKESKEEAEKRELRELLELQNRLNAEEGYGLSMYDKVKRRSSKERNSERDFFSMASQKKSPYQPPRRMKSRQPKSEETGSSTQEDEDESAASSSTMEMVSHRADNTKSKSRKRIIESSSDDEDDSSTPELPELLKEKENKKQVIKVSDVYYSDDDEDDELPITPKKVTKKKEPEKKEKQKKKKPQQIASDTDDEPRDKPFQRTTAPEKPKKDKKANKSQTTPETKEHPKTPKNQKVTPKPKSKKPRVFSSEDEEPETPAPKAKKEIAPKKHASMFEAISTEDDEPVVAPPKPKVKTKTKEKVQKGRVIESEEEKEQEKVVPLKSHKEKQKDKERKESLYSIPSIELDGHESVVSTPTTLTPKQKKLKDKHKASQKKDKQSEEIKAEEPEVTKPEKHKKNKDEPLLEHVSKSSHDKEKDLHRSGNKADTVLKEKDIHSNKDHRVRKDHTDIEKDCIEKEHHKDRSHQDAILSMMKDIRSTSIYEEEPKMPNLVDDKHPLDELLKEKARDEKRREAKIHGRHHDDSKKEDSRHFNDTLGPPEIRMKSEDRNDIDVHDDQEPPKLNKDEDSIKKPSKKDPKKGKKAKRKSKTHEEEITTQSVTSHDDAPSLSIKEEPMDQLPSLTKETLSEPPTLDETPIKDELSRSDGRRSGSDNIFEKMVMKEEKDLDSDLSLVDAPPLQPVITKKEVKKEAEKLKETSQDELQRAVNSILTTDTPPASAGPIDYKDDTPTDSYGDVLEDNPLIIEADVMSSDGLPEPTKSEDREDPDLTLVNEQDEEEARNAAAALAFDLGEALPEPAEQTPLGVISLPPDVMGDYRADDDEAAEPRSEGMDTDLTQELQAAADSAESLDHQSHNEELSTAEKVLETTDTVTESPATVTSQDALPPAEPEKREEEALPLESAQSKATLPEPEPPIDDDEDAEEHELIIEENSPKPEVKVEEIKPEPEAKEPEPDKKSEPEPEPEPEADPVPEPEIAPKVEPTPVLVAPSQVSPSLPIQKTSDMPVKQVEKDPYKFEDEPEESGPSLLRITHKHPHNEPRPVLSTIKPVLEESLPQPQEIPTKMRSPELGSPERRVFSDSEKVDTPRKSKRHKTKSARGRKKAEPELKLDCDDEPKLEIDLKAAENQEEFEEPAKPVLRHEEKSEEKVRHSPRAKEKAVLSPPPVSSGSLFEEEPSTRPSISRQSERPELKITIPLDPEAQKKVRSEARHQEALEGVSSPMEPPAKFPELQEEPPHVVEPPVNTEDLPVDDQPKGSQEVSEEELTSQESSDVASEEVLPTRRTKSKKKHTKESEHEEEKEPGSLTMTLSLRDVQRSPSTRVTRGKQEDATKKDGSEVTFSSRGRKIIPKERDGEVAPVGRKGRNKQGVNAAAAATPETPELRGRGRRGAASPAVAMMEPEVPVGAKGKGQRGRRASKRLENQEEAQEGEEKKEEAKDSKDEVEEEGSDTEERGRGGRKVPKRRASLRRQPGNEKEGVEKVENRDESSKDSSFHDENLKSETESTNDAAPENQRPKRPRRKGRKSVEGASMSPRRAEAPPGSPRGKGLDIGSTSPKNTEYKPVVKLEKLSNVEDFLRNQTPKEETGRKEDEAREREEGDTLQCTPHVSPRTGFTLNIRHGLRQAHILDAEPTKPGAKPKKDHYDFEDEEEKAPAEYVPRRTKRKTGLSHSNDDNPDAGPESKRQKVEEREEEPMTEDTAEDNSTKDEDEKSGVYLDPKTGLLVGATSPESQDTVEVKAEHPSKSDTKSDNKHEGTQKEEKPHLPPKVENKKHEDKAKEPQSVQPPKTEPTVPPLKITISGISSSRPATWETNMDNVIAAVARGDFSRDDEDTTPTRKTRKRSQEQHSPHTAPEPKSQPPTVTAAPTTTAAAPVSVASIAPVGKVPRNLPPVTTTQGLHGAPQVAYPVSSVMSFPSTIPAVTKAVHTGLPHTTLAPSMHAMPQQVPHPGSGAQAAHAQVSPGIVKSPTHLHGLPPHSQPGKAPQQQASQISPSVGSSVIQPPHHTPVSTSGVPPLNPIRQLEQSGYPVRDGATGEKDSQRTNHQQGNKSSGNVQMDVVQKAYTISQHEASPPGQVIEIVPNPNILSPKSSPAERGAEGPIHLPPTQQQAQREGSAPPRPGSKPQPHGGPSPHPAAQGKEQQAAGHPSRVGPLPPHMQHYPPYSHPVIVSQQSPSTTQTSSLPQTSELRAALATPSKLQQQEQLLQQQLRLQQQQQQQQGQAGPPGPLPGAQQPMMRPHQPLTPHQNEQQPSPGGTFGIHRMPFTYQDRPPGGISRAEPKVSQEQRAELAAASQFREHLQKAAAAGAQGAPPPAGGFPPQPLPDQRMLAHPDRPLPYPGGELRFPHPAVYPGGPLPGIGMGLPPRIGMDPRFMFPAGQGPPPPGHPGHHPEYLVAPGMIPHQHLLPHQQPPTAVDQILLQDRPPSAARPLSRTTPPSAQPSPRGTPTPGREIAPQALPPGSIPSALAQHPNQALNTLMKSGTVTQDSQQNADNLYMILRRYPVMWQGVLALKNDSSNVQMHYLAGSQRLVKLALPAMTLDGHSAPLRIAQRMRLEQSQLDGVHRKMQNEEEYSMLLAIPCGRDHIDIMTQTKALQSGFIQYLASKQAAGIVNVAEPGSQNQQPAYVVHIFPQCEFSHQQMADLTPDLLHGINEISHLLIIIATVGAQ